MKTKQRVFKCPKCNNEEKFILYTNEPFCINSKGNVDYSSIAYVLDDIFLCPNCKYKDYVEKFKKGKGLEDG